MGYHAVDCEPTKDCLAMVIAIEQSPLGDSNLKLPILMRSIEWPGKPNPLPALP